MTKSNRGPIYVTQPVLPDIEKVYVKLREIWGGKQLTNNGPLLHRFKVALQKQLNTQYLSLCCNGTMALQLACKALGLSGEVITTPFTFAATGHALAWNNLKPVFCDIDPYTFNIDPDKIEALITPATTAILPVHVFGHPCDTYKIQSLADQYKLKVIYDAAHCFGVELLGEPISSFGDVSIFSFHATKIFHTFEGGMVVCKDAETERLIDTAKNFGFELGLEVLTPGTNGKMNEFQAAIGLLMLDLFEEEIEKRRVLTQIYKERLSQIPGISFQREAVGTKHNYLNLTICVNEEFGIDRDALFLILKDQNIFTRKYFYPLLSQMQCYNNGQWNLPVAEQIASMVLSLPLYGNLEIEALHFICDTIEASQTRGN